MAQSLLSQGRSSETQPFGDEGAARRRGDLGALLAIQSRRRPGLLLTTEGLVGCASKEVNSENTSGINVGPSRSMKTLNTLDQLGQPVDQFHASVSPAVHSPANWIDFENTNSPMDYMGFSHTDTTSEHEVISDRLVNDDGIKEENRQEFFSHGRSSHGGDTLDLQSTPDHESFTVFKTRSVQNVFEDV